jgi:hypothetical protein
VRFYNLFFIVLLNFFVTCSMVVSRDIIITLHRYKLASAGYFVTMQCFYLLILLHKNLAKSKAFFFTAFTLHYIARIHAVFHIFLITVLKNLFSKYTPTHLWASYVSRLFCMYYFLPFWVSGTCRNYCFAHYAIIKLLYR